MVTIRSPACEYVLIESAYSGQLADLLYILDAVGLPNEHRKIIFNGDFVDRGDKGVEVLLLLLLLYITFPGK
jgi:serine/threonine-protein phosphatase with EF-hand domain